MAEVKEIKININGGIIQFSPEAKEQVQYINVKRTEGDKAMKRVAVIKANTAQGRTVAVVDKDKRTGDLLVKSTLAVDADSVWFTTMAQLKRQWRSVGFLVAACVATGPDKLTMINFYEEELS